MRIARPTDKLKDIIQFYEKGLGLVKVGGFKGKDHHGYEGVMYGLPGTGVHLEFTTHEEGTPCPAPTEDNLLVLYIPDKDAIEQIFSNLKKLGYLAVESENPYWDADGVTIEDPDGWRLVLMNTVGIG
ncbi:VOC family protein [Metabacillus sp. RGM 3146]|uniref:VOC family protein n=1 Tax=Metabacillus sp. RGM 3146 TaxID=3401092 RepID=UPI003B99A381